jgi:hypothetical protein
MLVLSQDEPVAARRWFHADGCARCLEAPTQFAGELFGRQQQGGHSLKAVSG